MGKRAVDVLLGTLLSLVALPVILALALTTAVMFRQWPFFIHQRVGKSGKRIRFPKLRTMPRATPRYATKDTATFDLPRLANFLRRTHFDELPQLFLVPLGKLSLVGPRPAMPEEYEPIDPNFRALRLSVPPGCTCLWQIGLHTDGLPSESPEYDEFYVQHANLRLDLVILFWTALRMVGLGPSRGLDELPPWAYRSTTRSLPVPAASNGHRIEPQSALLLTTSATTDLSDAMNASSS